MSEAGTAGPALFGAGRVHAALAGILGERCVHLDGQAPTDGRVMAVVTDDRRTRMTPRRPPDGGGDRPWLPVLVDGPVVLIGPAVVPGVPGCPTCADRRRAANRADRDGRKALRHRFGDQPVGLPNPLVTPVSAHVVATVVADELHRLARAADQARTRGAVLRFAMSTGLFTRHVLLPSALCPDCSTLPEDTPAAAVVPNRPLPKPDPSVFRTGTLAGRLTELTRTYVDSETGVITSIGGAARCGIPTAVARLGPPGQDDDASGYGRTADFRSAQLVAIAEALERHGGQRPRGRRTAVFAAYDEVADDAIDPRELGLYPDSWYERPGFPFAAFDPARPLAWVWGYSFGRAGPVLVPESYAYYGHRGGDRPLAYECSNGCALGGCLAEATFHGLLEIVERDAFLMTWYARLPAPALDLDSATDRRIPVLVETVRQRRGYEITARSITMEQRVPAVMVLAVDTLGRPDRPYHALGAAAGPSVESALHSALYEVAATIGDPAGKYDPGKAARLLADPYEVREMADHALLYGHPGTSGRLSFLSQGKESGMTPAALTAHAAWPCHHDLGQDLAELVRRFLDSGLDVITVDTTSPEQRACGFAGAKVIVPGTLPMTFGHQVRRTHGIPRLATVPRLLGHRSTDLPPEEVNPYPHAFP